MTLVFLVFRKRCREEKASWISLKTVLSSGNNYIQEGANSIQDYIVCVKVDRGVRGEWTVSFMWLVKRVGVRINPWGTPFGRMDIGP